jgi:hypothetical protein
VTLPQDDHRDHHCVRACEIYVSDMHRYIYI